MGRYIRKACPLHQENIEEDGGTGEVAVLRIVDAVE